VTAFLFDIQHAKSHIIPCKQFLIMWQFSWLIFSMQNLMQLKAVSFTLCEYAFQYAQTCANSQTHANHQVICTCHDCLHGSQSPVCSLNMRWRYLKSRKGPSKSITWLMRPQTCCCYIQKQGNKGRMVLSERWQPRSIARNCLCEELLWEEVVAGVFPTGSVCVCVCVCMDCTHR
jgi:hypothetical protein